MTGADLGGGGEVARVDQAGPQPEYNQVPNTCAPARSLHVFLHSVRWRDGLAPTPEPAANSLPVAGCQPGPRGSRRVRPCPGSVPHPLKAGGPCPDAGRVAVAGGGARFYFALCFCGTEEILRDFRGFVCGDLF